MMLASTLKAHEPLAVWVCRGAVAEMTSDDPVPQGAFGFVVRQRQMGLRPLAHDHLPIQQSASPRSLRLRCAQQRRRLRNLRYTP